MGGIVIVGCVPEQRDQYFLQLHWRRAEAEPEFCGKQTGQSGMDYSQDKDLGRVAMTMSKPPAPIETYKMTLSSTGGNKGKLQLEWENVIASVAFTVK